MRKIPRVYIAGKFRGPTNADVQRYIDVASWFQAPIAAAGCMPVCVHAMEGLKMHDLQQENAGQFWLDVTMDELRTCDAVVLVPGWQSSSGSYHEAMEAMRLGLPVFEAEWNEEILFSTSSLPAPAPIRWWDQIASIQGIPGTAYARRWPMEVSFDQWVASVTGGAK